MEISKEIETTLNETIKKVLVSLKESPNSSLKGQPLVIDEITLSVSMFGCNQETKKSFRQDNIPFIKILNPTDPAKIDVRKD